MKICVRGDTHLALTLERAARMRGFETVVSGGELYLCAVDVLDHANLQKAQEWFEGTLKMRAGSSTPNTPIVLVSQVPPGTTRKWAGQNYNIFYQVDTIIMKQALRRAYAPEQIVVGCNYPNDPLPLAYQEYLLAFKCPVLQMGYESAELAKCAINYHLAMQVSTSHELATAAKLVGADYADIENVLRNDVRIGSYLLPGFPNQHLMRDVNTIRKLL